MNTIKNYLDEILPLIKNQTTLDCSLFEMDYSIFSDKDFKEFRNDLFLSRDLTVSIIDVDENICYSGFYLSSEVYSNYKNNSEIIKENKKVTLDMLENYVNKELFVKCGESGYITYFFPELLLTIDFFDDMEN